MPKTIAAAVASVVLGLAPFHQPAGATLSARPTLPESGAWFGAFVAIGDHTGPDRQTAVTNFEAQIGRTLALERTYRFWGDPLIDSDDEWSRDHGRTLVMSWTGRLTSEGPYTRWADIAAGTYDGVIDENAARLADFGAPVFFIFDHEPERWVDKDGDVRAGTAQDYVLAYQHIRDRFVADGVTNVSYVLTLMAFTYTSGKGDLYYPGDAYVDLLAADGYNWFGCPVHDGPWRSFAKIFEDFHAYGVGKGKEMFVTEFGAGEDSAQPDRKAQWFTDASATVKSWPELKGVMYFHAAPEDGCVWWADSSEPALDAFIEVGADPYFNPPPPGDGFAVTITSGPDDPTVDTFATFAFSSDDPSATFRCGLDGSALVDCASPVTYADLLAGPHSFIVQATNGQGFSTEGGWTWTVLEVGADVTVADFAFSPAAATARQGTAVRWTFDGPSEHSVQDASGMSLFLSDVQQPGAVYDFVFVGAGSYRYACTVTPSMTGSVRVPIVAPSTGQVGVAFTVMAGSADAPTGFGFDIQVQKPGSSRYAKWLNGAVSPTAEYTADIAGTYRFRARLRNLATGRASNWSPSATVVVT